MARRKHTEESKETKTKSTKTCIEEVKEEFDQNSPKLIWAPEEEPSNYYEEPAKAKLWARWAWFTGKYKQREIAEAICVTPTVIKSWIRGTSKVKGWSQERAELDGKLGKQLVKKKVAAIEENMDKMLKVIKRSMDEILDDNETLTVGEINQLSSAYDKLFKARQLSEGRPTDIYGDSNGTMVTWNEALEKLRGADIIDVTPKKKES